VGSLKYTSGGNLGDECRKWAAASRPTSTDVVVSALYRPSIMPASEMHFIVVKTLQPNTSRWFSRWAPTPTCTFYDKVDCSGIESSICPTDFIYNLLSNE
jgi:hypothetical protein